MKIFVRVLVFLIVMAVIAVLAVFFGYRKMSFHVEDLLSLFKEKSEAVVKGQSKPVPVTVYLSYGGTMEGMLVKETETEYTIAWKNQEFVLDKSQVERIEKSDGAFGWIYGHDCVVKLKNGSVIDYEIVEVKPDKVVLSDSATGNDIRMEIDRNDIEHLLFKPVGNDESREIDKMLRRKFPDMDFYSEGNVTIVTDAYITWVKEYKKNIRIVTTEIYLEFFRIFKTRQPFFQNYIVIFDNYGDFVEHAIDEGVPGWAVLGYFNTDSRVTYLFNVLGDQFSKDIYEMIIGQTTRAVDAQAEMIKGYYGQDGHVNIMVDGHADNIKDKFWLIYNRIISECRQVTLSTLRHEFTHELFSNWGLQNIEVSRSEKSGRLNEKKKEILESKDMETKRQWLEDLIVYKSEINDLDLKASNSWIVEGLATYCETFPIGKQNDRWLFIFQEMIEKDEVYPLEVLNQYKMGSFPGMYEESVIRAYAQSWAFVVFLMEKYPDEFVEYMGRSASVTVRTDKEELELFLECLGKDPREIEKEFVKHFQENYEPLPDPNIEQLLYIRDLFKEFM